MTTSNISQNQGLEPLFEIELQYREGLEAITSPEGKLGEYLGSGDGTVRGAKLQGMIRWDLYEKLSETRCQTNFAGVIETNDGAQIQYDAKGFGMVTDKSKPNEWHMTYAVQFDTKDERYEWLNTTLGLWDGEFDMATYRHHYQVYAKAG
jgi:hypothetical protein